MLQVGGIIAWGASHYVGHSIYSWQLLFLVLGCVTVVWACFIGWWVPDSPMKAKCFSEVIELLCPYNSYLTLSGRETDDD